MAKSTANTPTHSAKGVGSQNSTQHSFDFPNPICALQCTGDLFNYSACYNQCINPPTVVQNPGTGSANPAPATNLGGNPVVDPKTGKPTTSGPATQGSQPSNQPYPTPSGLPQSPTGTPINWQDVGIRAGLVIGGSILIIVGIIKIFGSPAERVVSSMNQPMSNPQLARRPSTPPQPIVTKRSYVETRKVNEPPQTGEDVTHDSDIHGPVVPVTSGTESTVSQPTAAVRPPLKVRRRNLAHK